MCAICVCVCVCVLFTIFSAAHINHVMFHRVEGSKLNFSNDTSSYLTTTDFSDLCKHMVEAEGRKPGLYNSVSLCVCVCGGGGYVIFESLNIQKHQ